MRGISYACGAHPPEVVRRALSTIRDDLHCTTVMLMDSDPERLVDAVRAALEAGLDVYVRPRLPDARQPALLRHLATVAAGAEELRTRYPGRVTLLLGSEFSLTARGIVPGPREFVRLQLIMRWRRLLGRRITRRLHRWLTAALTVARRHFHGPVTYAAAFWETVDWSGFDIVGVSLYRSGTDPDRYARRIRALVRGSDKPVVITEFGCGAHRGADVRGPGSFRIVGWFAARPHVRDGHVRDERTQATYLTELIDLYEAEGVHGCFVFTFVMPEFPHSDVPRDDLDMAGFGVVAVPAGNPANWRPKEAFHAVADRYRRRE